MNLVEKKMWEPGQNLSRQTPSRSGKFESLPASAEFSWWLQREPKWLVYAKCVKLRHQSCAICECYQPCVLHEIAAMWPQTEGYLEKVLLQSDLLHWKTQGNVEPSAARICSGPHRATPITSSGGKQGQRDYLGEIFQEVRTKRDKHLSENRNNNQSWDNSTLAFKVSRCLS